MVQQCRHYVKIFSIFANNNATLMTVVATSANSNSISCQRCVEYGGYQAQSVEAV